MKKLLFFVVVLGFFGCKPKVITPITDKIKKNWAVQTAKHGGSVVYTKGAASNTTDYSGFRLNLSAAPSATYVAFDKNTFSGQYDVTGTDEKQTTGTLNLKNLNPVPSGSGGNISFSIISLTETTLVLSRTTADQKTGGSLNEYTLVAQ
jgi:hypothetical protein